MVDYVISSEMTTAFTEKSNHQNFHNQRPLRNNPKQQTRDFWKLLIMMSKILPTPLLTNIYLITEQPDSGQAQKSVVNLTAFEDSFGVEHVIQ